MICCNRCGRTNVETARWVDDNTGALGELVDAFAASGSTGTFCRDCDEDCVALDDSNPDDAATIAKRFPAAKHDDDDDLCECADDVVPGAGWPFDSANIVQRCDMCCAFADDDTAGEAVVVALNHFASLRLVPAGVYSLVPVPPGGEGNTLRRDGVELSLSDTADLYDTMLSASRVRRVLRDVLGHLHSAEVAGHVPRDVLLAAHAMAD